jgi:hypothetical protein
MAGGVSDPGAIGLHAWYNFIVSISVASIKTYRSMAFPGLPYSLIALARLRAFLKRISKSALITLGLPKGTFPSFWN